MSHTIREHVGNDVVEQEIKHEQSVVDRIYSRLEAAADAARRLAADGHARARLGNQGGLVERDAIVFQAARRLASLDAAHDGLVFGRLDMRGGETRYVGRLGLRDERRDVLLVDWRAPAAAVFYQATAQEPSGVVRRRVLQSSTDRVVAIDDDLLDTDSAPADMVVVGEGALLAALTRTRDRTMHSVVATIQKEQDDAIRAPHRGYTTISGGPGTGKTVVALHRAAYLLYTDRRRYEAGGVLVVGPNAVFIAYIQRVLPSLGETSVSLRALGEVVDGVTAVRHDEASVAVLKGSARMRQLLARTAGGPVPAAPSSFRIFYRDDVLRLDAHQLDAIRRRLLAGGAPRNPGAAKVAGELTSALWEQVAGDRAREQGRDAFGKTMRESSDFLEFVRAWWPALDAVDVLGWLADKDRLARDAGRLLSPREVDDLSESLGGEPTVEDIPLIDELRYLLGDAPQLPDDEEGDVLDDLDDETVPELSTHGERTAGTATTAGGGRPTASVEDDRYAHVLVDEAQDLSPMQWRMLGRRGRWASWTVVGDLAQASWSDLEEAAQAREEAFGSAVRRGFHMDTNYRNAREIFDLAARMIRQHVPDADIPDAVRETGHEPLELTAPAASVVEVGAAAVQEMLGQVDGQVAIITPQVWRAAVEPLAADDERVVVVDPLSAKGLEWDATLVLDPDAIVKESPGGVRVLYVALTRAAHRMAVLRPVD